MLTAAALCLIVAVIDRDTLTARCGDPGQYNQVRVRLSAIDAPEKGQPFGAHAKEALSDLCFKRQATLRTVATDRYGRTVADVRCGDKDAGTEMVRAGNAWVYDQYAARYPQLYPLQASARTAHRGLWSARAPTPPWEYRHQPAVAAQPDASGCITGPRGGRYTISTTGRKHYGC